jgi:hypothetical protein
MSEADHPKRPDSEPVTSRNVGFNRDNDAARESMLEAIYKDPVKKAKAIQLGGDRFNETLSLNQLKDIVSGHT